ncbi:MAG: hypothetical protein HRU28_03235 [Rhizobiales bacterium]|nr:hypothetical protein [Hyphomicrobiales bacterium]
MGWDKTKHEIGREAFGSVKFIAYLVTHNEKRAKSNETALVLAERLTTFIDGHKFVPKCRINRTPPTASNIAVIDRKGSQINFWALVWEQVVSFGNSANTKLGADGDGRTLGQTIEDAANA